MDVDVNGGGTFKDTQKKESDLDSQVIMKQKIFKPKISVNS